MPGEPVDEDGSLEVGSQQLAQGVAGGTLAGAVEVVKVLGGDGTSPSQLWVARATVSRTRCWGRWCENSWTCKKIRVLLRGQRTEIP